MVKRTNRQPGKTPAQRARRRRQRRNRQANNPLREMSSLRIAAPTASALSGRRYVQRRGAFAPVKFTTSDLLASVQLGVESNTVVYNTLLSPQALPPASRGLRMARLYSKYRPLRVVLRVESAISTAAGGQYGAFFDPNPANNWVEQDAIGALTSMPVQDIAASWECLKLIVPASELSRKQELYTEDITNEKLVTQFGQLVLMTLAVPSVTPPGSAVVTVWMDADFEFYEPNVSAELSQAPILIDIGDWNFSGTNVITHPPSHPSPLPPKAVFKAFPPLPTTFTSFGIEVVWLATYASEHLLAFQTEAEANAYAEFNNYAGAATAHTVPQTLPETALLVTARYSPSLVKYPYFANP